MNFKIKIFIVTLAILIFTLVLNSVLSIFSFEKIYTQSLISTYEMAGLSLKRKIEQSLYFGKPLKNFQGMDKLLADLAQKNPHLSRIWIESLDGTELYHGKTTTAEKQKKMSHPELSEETEHKTQLIQGEYITAIPLNKRIKRVGTLYFSFPKSVIYIKLQEMAGSNVNTLWLFMLNSAFCLIFMMAFFIFRPFKNDIKGLTGILKEKTSEKSLPTPPTKKSLPQKNDTISGGFNIKGIGNEINELAAHLNNFVSLKNRSLANIHDIHTTQHALFQLCNELTNTLEKMAQEADSLPQAMDPNKKKMLEKLLHHNMIAHEMVQIVQDFARSMEASTTSQAILNRADPDTP